MNLEKLQMMREKKGFIAALDQSGGSSAKTLKLYGVLEDQYSSDDEMFDLIHEMRTRVMMSENFTNDQIIGVILFEETMNRNIQNELTSDYLWNQKRILSFLKIDKGLDEEKDGVQLMKDISNLSETLEKAHSLGIFGTKMRSVIHKANREGIRNVVKQQFELAEKIYSYGLIPIIEPEVNIHSEEKYECEKILKEEILNMLNETDIQVMFKFSIPSIDNFYGELIDNPNVVRVVALSGGYSRNDACNKLANNSGMIASFSRALLEGLVVTDSLEEFDLKLKKSIDEIYEASVR